RARALFVEGEPADAVGTGFSPPVIRHELRAPSLCRRLRLLSDLEVAYERQMVRIADVRDVEVRDLDAFAVEHEVELFSRRAARIGRQPARVRAAQAGRFHEKVDLVLAPEGVEVAGDDDRFFRLQDQIVKGSKLRMAMAILERQMHEKNRAILELELDDQALDA